MQRGFSQSFGRACRTQFNRTTRTQQARFGGSATQAQATEGATAGRTTTRGSQRSSQQEQSQTTRNNQQQSQQSQQSSRSQQQQKQQQQQNRDQVIKTSERFGAQASRNAIAMMSRYSSLASLSFATGEVLMLSGALAKDDG